MTPRPAAAHPSYQLRIQLNKNREWFHLFSVSCRFRPLVTKLFRLTKVIMFLNVPLLCKFKVSSSLRELTGL